MLIPELQEKRPQSTDSMLEEDARNEYATLPYEQQIPYILRSKDDKQRHFNKELRATY